jgi:hypothetical protein
VYFFLVNFLILCLVFYLQRIPKEIVKALNIPKQGWAILSMGEYYNKQETSYYTSADGGISFELGWAEFVQKFDMEGSDSWMSVHFKPISVELYLFPF